MTEHERWDVKGRMQPVSLATPSKSPQESPLGSPRDSEEARQKPINLSREGPVLHRQVDSQVQRLKADLKKALTVAAVSRDAYREHPNHLKSGDRALFLQSSPVSARSRTALVG